MCSKPIFCSKVAQKGKICSKLLESQKGAPNRRQTLLKSCPAQSGKAYLEVPPLPPRGTKLNRINLFPNLQEGDLTAKFNPKWIVKFEEMVENLKSRKAQVCDSRGPAMYNKKPDGNMHNNNFILYLTL